MNKHSSLTIRVLGARKRPYVMYRERSPRSACAPAQYDTKSDRSCKYIGKQGKHWPDCADMHWSGHSLFSSEVLIRQKGHSPALFRTMSFHSDCFFMPDSCYMRESLVWVANYAHLYFKFSQKIIQTWLRTANTGQSAHICTLITAFPVYIKWCTVHEKSPNAICGQRRPWLACAFAQADLGLRSPLTESMDTVVCFDKQRLSWLNCTDAQPIWTVTVRMKHKGLFPTLHIMYIWHVFLKRMSHDVS